MATIVKPKWHVDVSAVYSDDVDQSVDVSPTLYIQVDAIVAEGFSQMQNSRGDRTSP